MDPEGVIVALDVGTGDTCGGVIENTGNGTGVYRFTPNELLGGNTCVLQILCSDGMNSVSQTETIFVYRKFVFVSAGFVHTCGINTAGAAWCWGNNEYGQLGDGTIISQSTPVSVSGLNSGVTFIATGEAHTCAIQNGVAKCWGWNNYGQLGDTTNTTRTTPVWVH